MPGDGLHIQYSSWCQSARNYPGNRERWNINRRGQEKQWKNKSLKNEGRCLAKHLIAILSQGAGYTVLYWSFISDVNFVKVTFLFFATAKFMFSPSTVSQAVNEFSFSTDKAWFIGCDLVYDIVILVWFQTTSFLYPVPDHSVFPLWIFVVWMMLHGSRIFVINKTEAKNNRESY